MSENVFREALHPGLVVAFFALTGMMLGSDARSMVYAEITMMVSWLIQFFSMFSYALVIGAVPAFLVNVFSAVCVISWFTLESEEQKSGTLAAAGVIMAFSGIFVAVVSFYALPPEVPPEVPPGDPKVTVYRVERRENP